MWRSDHRRLGAALLLVALSIGACDDAPMGESVDLIPAVPTPADEGAPGDGDASAMDGATPMPVQDGGLALPGLSLPTTGSICSVKVGAECDGSEDCSGGQVCCGRFNPVGFAYESIGCAATCGQDDYTLCHPGDECPGDGMDCRASLVLPYNFVGVCAAPADAPQLVGEAIAGQILCGEARCLVGEQKCCYRERFEFASGQTEPLEPYCAPLDDVCSCDHVEQSAGELDAGVGESDDEGDAG